MASKLKIKVNGLVHNVTASLDTPLLYVLHNELHLHGPRFGCGLAQCGACSVLLDGKEIRSCVTPVTAVSGKPVTTLEGLPALWVEERGITGAKPALHPVQKAWIDLEVPHCGFCQNGMMIQAADLLSTTESPTEEQIRTAMNGHLCRCGTYPRILTAIQKAAAAMAIRGEETTSVPDEKEQWDGTSPDGDGELGCRLQPLCRASRRKGGRHAGWAESGGVLARPGAG